MDERVISLMKKFEDMLEKMASSVRRLGRLWERVDEDVDVLYESDERNFWVLVRALHTDVFDLDDPVELMRRIGELQSEYDAVVSVVEFMDWVSSPADAE